MSYGNWQSEISVMSGVFGGGREGNSSDSKSCWICTASTRLHLNHYSWSG